MPSSSLRPALALVAAWGLAVAACSSQAASDQASGPDAGEEITFAQHIQPILEARCTQCHNDRGIGPFPLLTYEDANRWANIASHSLETRSMPPFPPSGETCAPLMDRRAMTEEERQLFYQWEAEGRKPGDPDAPRRLHIEDGNPGLTNPTNRYPFEIEYYPPYEIFEEHRCFAIDPKLTEATRFQGVHADTAAPERYHQARVYVVPPERLSELDELEGSDGRPGWPCYFNSGMDRIEPVGRMFPGIPFEAFPDGSAMEVEAGSKFVVDAYLHHYTFEPLDLSVVAWKADEQTSKAPSIVQLGARDFVIPIGAESVVRTVEAEVVAANVDLDTYVSEASSALHAGSVWSVDAHMHHWGRSVKIEVVHANGSKTCLLDIPEWDEEWQGNYTLVDPIEVAPGDTIVATCEWSNLPEDRPIVRGVPFTPSDLTWGLDELNEMCDVRLMMTPSVN